MEMKAVRCRMLPKLRTFCWNDRARQKAKCSDGRLFLPESAKCRCYLFLVESLLGQPLKVLRSSSNYLNISSLSEGVYVLKA